MGKRNFWGGLAAALCIVTAAPAEARTYSFEEWLKGQENASLAKLFLNISPPGTRRGVVIASPSRHAPDYFYHWVRDAGLVMDLVSSLYFGETDPDLKATYYDRLMDFAAFSRENQRTFNLSGGLGEPKFYVDGRPYDQPWGRPQNDGPAIRAISLARFALALVREGNAATVRERLYDGRIPAESVIKADLEFVAHHWRETSFDVWEEVRGLHFFTLLFQRRSMLLGAELADEMGDAGAAVFYRQQAEAMKPLIERHWDESRGQILATLDRDEGIDYKFSGLDSAVVIAALRADAGDGFFTLTDDRLLATLTKAENEFRTIYPINWGGGLSPAIGRYPEDRYDGGINLNQIGNPWVLTTCTYAEYFYKIAREFEKRGRIEITSRNFAFFQSVSPMLLRAGETIERGDARFESTLLALRMRGDSYFHRLRLHAHQDGSLSEQLNRDTGFMQGARDLTWSHAACLTATWER